MNTKSPFEAVLPKQIKVGKDKLELRLDFYGEAIVMQKFNGQGGTFAMVSPEDITKALSRDITFNSGLLPENTVWCSFDRSGIEAAIWMPPGIRLLGLRDDPHKPALRFNVPLPGLLFICRACQPPRVFAAHARPIGLRDKLYHAPLANIYWTGATCGGSNKYPADLAEIPESFLRSFFTSHANISGRSKLHPDNIILIWRKLDKAKAKEYPLNDLVYHSTVADVMGAK